MIKNLSDAKAGSGHKKNKSDSNARRHVKNSFSMLDVSQGEIKDEAAHERKASKIVSKEAIMQ
jgi:hypothetical protein